VRHPAAEQFAEKHDPSPSAAKACTGEKALSAALKRCATQNQCFPADCEAERISVRYDTTEVVPLYESEVLRYFV
jgi:hypothetical protein